MSQYPNTEWTGGRIATAVVAGVVPLIIVFGSVYLRLPRQWMRCDKSDCSVTPNWILWGGLFILSLIWVLLGISIPIALDGVAPQWWILPMFNFIIALLPFVFPIAEGFVGTFMCLLLSIGTLVQYAAAQRSWLATLCVIPYVLWCLHAFWFLIRMGKPRALTRLCQDPVILADVRH